MTLCSKGTCGFCRGNLEEPRYLKSITIVFQRIKEVLVLIRKGNGFNKPVEIKWRGGKFEHINLPPAPQQETATLAERENAVQYNFLMKIVI